MPKYLVANSGEAPRYIQPVGAEKPQKLNVGQNILVELEEDDARHLRTTKGLTVSLHREPAPPADPEPAVEEPKSAEPAKSPAKK